MIRSFLFCLLLRWILVLPVYGAAQSGVELPPGKNRELVIAICSGCHSLQLVQQNHMTREGWDRTLRWMEAKHKLTFFSPAVRVQILDYLAEHLAPQALVQDGVSGLPRMHLNGFPP